MTALARTANAIDALNKAIGILVAWLALGTVVVCFATVYLRYALNTNYIWMQELYVWQHMLAIVLGAAFTMQINGFVRVDIFYGKMSPRGRAWVDLAGTLVFLFPFLIVLMWAFWPQFMSSYRANEGSPNPSGLPYWWLLNLALVVFVVLTALQGLSAMFRSILVLNGRLEHAGPATTH
jgi:TRAP-type mannitol/chloroaromatic compound transport system permease small subunit